MNRRSFLTKLLAVPLAPVAVKLTKVLNPSALRPIGFNIEEKLGFAIYDPAVGVPQLITVPMLPIYSNPTISLEEIKTRRFHLGRYDDMVEALARPLRTHRNYLGIARQALTVEPLKEAV
jgi:hypothetical protein